MDLTKAQRAGIKAARLAAGLTHTQLAARIGVSARTLSRWEAGSHNPTQLGLEALRRELPGVDLPRSAPAATDVKGGAS